MFRKLFVVRHRSYRKDFEVAVPGYIDTETRSYNFFVREILLFGTIMVHYRILFKERVPNWAWIQEGTQGFTEWRSSAPQELWDLCRRN